MTSSARPSTARPRARTAARPAAAATTYTPVRYPGGAPLDATAQHWVRRFTYGYTPALAEQIRAAGGVRPWFERQLQPASIPDAAADALITWWPSLRRSPQELWQRQVDEIEGGWVVMASYGSWLLQRRITTQRQVHEMMTEFWESHFHVPVNGDAPFVHRVSYGDAIRRHALGRFAALLEAAVTHPAMGIFLDNAVSTARTPNENLGRELLELHTVGRGAYTETDVKNSARILTGYRVQMWSTWVAEYKPADHAVGPVRVMDFQHANAAPDGRPVVRAYLSYLARHPATARRICRRLAVKFVSDDPPAALVDHLVQVYLSSGTDISAVLRALVARPEFTAAAAPKVRDPGEDVVATYRALGAQITRPTVTDGAAVQIVWQAHAIGSQPFAWGRPDGPPIDNAAWSSGSRALASFSFHWSVAGGWYPSKDITYRTPAQWLPRTEMSFAMLVDYLCIRMLGRVSTAAILRACCEVTNYAPATRITAQHNLLKWEFHRLLSTILDTPDHLTR
ncbi:DUF1800 domain-containing protein [Nocardioides alkalitolerans]|uniref:DUF1800 domain-containing protein n=1 Tax=Nocardioides alkalitolerans TaxID=281714 RepID=UPI00146FBF53|nr:DUF1800 domain-containing protein [Nocardioides alkalitolerans]